MAAIQCAVCERLAILRCADCKRYFCGLHCRMVRLPGEGKARGMVRVYCLTCKPNACLDG